MSTQRILLSLLPLAACAALSACSSGAEPTTSASAAASVTSALDPERLYEDGFDLVTTPSCSADPTGEGCDVAVLDESSGALVDPGGVHWASFDFSFGLSPRDKKTVGDCAGKPNDCYTVYVFPSKIRERSYDDLASQMREYSKLVGTLLHRTAKGPGEETWVNYHRSDAFRAVVAAADKGTSKFCGAVVKSFIDSLVPEGSDFRQYGNCGEGGHVGACLASKAGFGDEEIRLCASDNDHFFAMVKDENHDKKWCVLDRWSLIDNDNYACDVDWDQPNRAVTFKGEAVDQEWFKKVTCTTLKQYLANGASVD